MRGHEWERVGGVSRGGGACEVFFGGAEWMMDEGLSRRSKKQGSTPYMDTSPGRMDGLLGEFQCSSIIGFIDPAQISPGL